MNMPIRNAVALALFLGLAGAGVAVAAADAQRYPTPEDAATALVDALGTTAADQQKLATVLGDEWQDVVPDGSVARADVDAFLAGYAQKHAFTDDAAGRRVLAVGDAGWTLPVPLTKDAAGWYFDLAAGADEIRIRRVGRNELAAAEAARTYHDAQMDYAEEDRDDDGVLEYAQNFFSADGGRDGLYWESADDADVSPLGPLFGENLPDGDWQGYRFRILRAQGPSAPGGAYDYLLGDNLSRGFALIAWPAEYGDSGITTFMISHDGIVFEKDLGKDGAAWAEGLTVFDPDDSWTESTAVLPAD